MAVSSELHSTIIIMSVNDIRNATADQKFEVKAGEAPSNATFIFGDEDHTLGNALRHIIIQKSDTEFCGYSVPHPYEPKMNIRLQTRKEIPSVQVLKNGLKELEKTADALEDAFSAALEEYARGSKK